MQPGRIEVTLDHQQPQTKSKILNLLKRYNATMGFNENDNMFEVDLQVKFDSVDQKDKFVRAYFSKMRHSSVQKGQVLAELQNEQNSLQKSSNQDSVKELRKQKEQINVGAFQAVNQYAGQYASNHPTGQHGNSGLVDTPVKGQQFKERREGRQQSSHYQTPPHNSLGSADDPSQPLNYQLLDHKLELTVNEIFRQLFTKNYFSESKDSIKIVGDTYEEQPDVMPYVPLFGSQSPSTINPASSDRDRLNIIREINGQIADLQEQSVSSLHKYGVEEVIEEQQSELSEDSQVDKKKQQHFKFLEERLKGRGTKKVTEPRKVVFEEGKFRQFLQLEKNKIEDLFEDMKKGIRVGSNPALTNTKKAPTGNSRVRGRETSGKDQSALWRSQLSTSRDEMTDTSQQFSKRFYEVFQARLIAENRSMSSSELVSYFKYLLANARKLYVDFVRNRSFAREHTGVKTK